ncbi:MAG: hypothetical protein V2J55_16075 [Candidatus Competibacteraceae bacterium]|jgi:hypothetical protein|nr:hypothetical protein [Candidatus Competibacteraceae bacterium]
MLAGIFEQIQRGLEAQIVSSIPRGFWEDIRGSAKQAYRDVYAEVKADPNVVDEQRLNKLHQDRHFRMENVFLSLAQKHNLDYSAALIERNKRTYVYVVTNSIGITQAYVKRIGDRPNPARYRESLARVSAVPRLDLGDDPISICMPKQFYGLITHNPLNHRKFDESSQQLAMMQLCIPTLDSKKWAYEFSIEEVLAMYPETEKSIVSPNRKPTWKDRKSDSESSSAE